MSVNNPINNKDGMGGAIILLAFLAIIFYQFKETGCVWRPGMTVCGPGAEWYLFAEAVFMLIWPATYLIQIIRYYKKKKNL